MKQSKLWVPVREAIWQCKIGSYDKQALPMGADGPMRRAAEKAYLELTGASADFCFSGWGFGLTAGEVRAATDE